MGPAGGGDPDADGKTSEAMTPYEKIRARLTVAAIGVVLLLAHARCCERETHRRHTRGIQADYRRVTGRLQADYRV